jgi:hypothetical protein
VKFKISKKLLTGYLTIFAAIAAVTPTIRSAIASPQQFCSNDRPCFRYAYPQKSGNDIMFKFNSEYIDLQVATLQIAGAETEFTFEKKQEGWRFAGGAGLDYGKGLEHTGKGNGWVRNTSGWNAINNWLNLQPNTRCTVSAWLRTSDTLTDGYMSVRDRSLYSDGRPGRILNEIKLVGAGTPNPEHKNYNLYTFHFNSGGGGKLLFYVGLWGKGKDAWIQVDDVTVSCRI